MPVADFATYCRMIDSARGGRFAYPGINVSSMSTASAVLRGLAEARSDGIVQVSTGGGAFASGSAVKDSVLGAIALAEYVHRVADRYDIYVALHTDHCPVDAVDSFLIPLIEETERRRSRSMPNLFNSHMFDGSAVPLGANLDRAVPLLERCARNELILEIEAGVVGGEEDGISAEGTDPSKLYTTPEDMLEVARRMKGVPGARYLLAATFGNVHGVYKPGQVKLKPEILREGQEAVERAYGGEARFALVFHGGSGSSVAEIREAIDYGVVKMNIDTDTQYAFSRAVADHVFRHYDGMLKVDGEMGAKKQYDPRTYLGIAESAMADRVRQAVEDLRGSGTTLCARGSRG